MSETKVEIIPAKEVSAVMSHAKSCMCEICQPGSGMAYSPEGSSGAEQRIAALEEQLQIRDAEIHLLKESRAAAVSQEQTSRVECNKLRTQLAEAQAKVKSLNPDTIEAGLERIEVQKLERRLAEAQAACAEMRSELAKTEFGDRHGYDQKMHCFSCGVPKTPTLEHHPKCTLKHALSSTCGQSLLAERDRLRKALMNLWNKGPDCPGVQEEVETALKRQP